MAKVVSSRTKDKPTYRPEASYKWEPDDVFEFTGQQLAYLFHCLNIEVNSAEGATIGQKYQAYEAVMDVFKKGVEQGAIVESAAPDQSMKQIEDSVTSLFPQ